MSEILIDALTPCVLNGRWHWRKSSHMTSRDLTALHAFAARIGLKRVWFQADKRLPHYDLNERRRAAAVAAGAVEIDRNRLVAEMEFWLTENKVLCEAKSETP